MPEDVSAKMHPRFLKGRSCLMDNGYCQVLVQTDKIPGEIRIKAKSGNLKDGEVTLIAK